MWAVDLRQSHEIPKGWIENASDLNSVLKKGGGQGETPPPPVAKTGLSGKHKPIRELWE